MTLSVLVVDDEETVREMLGWMLDDAGYVTHTAPGGHEALAFMRSRHPVDIVLSDINMPEMDGVALCKLIEIEFPNVPVLLISGRPRPNGIKSFVAKPFRAQVLTREIEQLTSATQKPAVRRISTRALTSTVSLPNPPSDNARNFDRYYTNRC